MDTLKNVLMFEKVFGFGWKWKYRRKAPSQMKANSIGEGK